MDPEVVKQGFEAEVYGILDQLQKDIHGLKTQVKGIRTPFETVFARLETMIMKLMVHRSQHSGAAPPPVQGALFTPSANLKTHPPSGPLQVTLDPQPLSSALRPHPPSNAPSPSVEGNYNPSPIVFARRREQAGPTATRAQAVSDISSAAIHTAEGSDTVQREARTGIGRLKKIVRMLSMRRLKQ